MDHKNCVVVHCNQKKLKENNKYLEAKFTEIGGKITKLDRLRAQGSSSMLFIHYENVEDAQKVLKTKNFSFKKSKIPEECWAFSCQPYKKEKMAEVEDEQEIPSKSYDNNKDVFINNRVFVHINTKDFKEDDEYLKSIFSNNELTGGGEISHLEVNAQCCIIEFVDAEVANRLVTKRLKIKNKAGAFYEFHCVPYSSKNTRINKKKTVDKLEITDTIFEKRYMKHFLLFENRQANLYWLKAYADLK